MSEDRSDPIDNANLENGTIVPWSCPECSGTLWENRFGPLVQFRCRVGHAYSAESFLTEHSSTIERSLWAVIRLLEERAAVEERLAKHAAQFEQPDAERKFAEEARAHRRRAEIVRQAFDS